MSDPRGMLHPELLDHDDTRPVQPDGRRLDHAEGSSKPLRAAPEPQPRGAKIHGESTGRPGGSSRPFPCRASAREDA